MSNDATTAKLADTEEVTAPQKSSLANYFERHASEALVIISLGILIVFFSIMSPYFLSVANFSAILLDGAVYVLLALGLVFVIATGGIDLTPGFGIAFTSVFCALAMVHTPGPVALKILVGVLAGILSGTLLGMANGFLVAYMGLQPMIATLAMMLVAWGVALTVTGTSAVPVAEYEAFLWLGNGRTFGITNSLWLVITASVIAHILLTRTLIGRYALAMGSNEEATRLSGVNVKAWKFRVYALAATFTGLAGVLMASKLGSGKPDVGQSYEMYAIAAAVLGGASLRGGRANVLGAAIGAILIATIRNGSVLLAIPEEIQKIILGLVVIGAVYLDARRGDN